MLWNKEITFSEDYLCASPLSLLVTNGKLQYKKRAICSWNYRKPPEESLALLAKGMKESEIIWNIAVSITTNLIWVAVYIVNKSSAPCVLPTIIMWVAHLVNPVHGMGVCSKKPLDNKSLLYYNC
jgi:hypothetical protein